MKRLFLTVAQTLLRMVPWPCRTGLVAVGSPGRDSPVLLTGNYRLTVDRVRRALAGRDAWLLVANSRGVNVWCAATGGLLTDHDVVSVLKTSGIAERVDHRQVILPQLAATGLEGPVVRRKTGWRVVWGPVYADQLAAFLDRGLEKSPAMRVVEFPWRERLEMAVAWAFPISLLAFPVGLLWPEGRWPLVALVWGFASVLFLGFPAYRHRLESGSRRRFAILEFGGGAPLALGLAFVAGAVAAASAGWIAGGLALGLCLATPVVLGVLGLDLMGSTPVFKSGLHDDRLLRIGLDEDRCRGAGFCRDTCPVDVFDVDEAARVARLARAERCVQCGACLVQCPFDALHFAAPDGARIEAETVRKFKLNLMGSRQVRVGAGIDEARPEA